MLMPKELYPTPEKVAYKMLQMVDWRKVNSILEPSAGYGNLASAASRHYRMKNQKYSPEPCEFDEVIDMVEIDEKCLSYLKSKGAKIVGEDFLRFQTFTHYDLIVMNPPFSEGCKHLLKAIEMQKYGGQICCLLNAETIKNPCTFERQLLAEKIEQYGAKVEDFGTCFKDSDRPTDVEIYCVYFDVPKGYESDIFKNLEKAQEVEKEEPPEETQIVSDIDDYIKAIVGQYERECKAGLSLINEYEAVSSRSLDTFDTNDYPNRILQLTVHGTSKYSKDISNAFVEKVRYKYWKTLFGRPEMLKLMTGKMQQEYYSQLEELKNYEFNLRNIYQIQVDLSQSTVQNIEQAIMDLFHEFARDHSWYADCSKNIHHYYNGWATNKCGVINKKVIIPLDAFDSYYGRFNPGYRVESKIADIEKVFTYLDYGSAASNTNVGMVLKIAEENGQSQNIDFKYFTITFYKKGTVHIRFKDDNLLRRFNIFAGRKEGGLPPSYGKKAYKDMSPKEKLIIDEFEGEENYNTVFESPNNFIIEGSMMLTIGRKEDIK